MRNHLPVPDVDPNTYILEIEIEGKSENVTLSLDDLKKFPRHTVTSTVMCAGNRRSEMHKVTYLYVYYILQILENTLFNNKVKQ